jgi:hypothetical protein
VQGAPISTGGFAALRDKCRGGYLYAMREWGWIWVGIGNAGKRRSTKLKEKKSEEN